MNHIQTETPLPRNTLLSETETSDFAPLSSLELTVDDLGVNTLQSTGTGRIKKIDADVTLLKDGFKVDKKVDGLKSQIIETNLPRVPLTQFRPLSLEQVEKMDIQQLLIALLQSCFLIQHETKRFNQEFLQTLQITLDAVVKKLSEQQASTLWSVPSFISIGLTGVSSVVGDAKSVLEALGGATKIVADLVPQSDKSKETPIGAQQSQVQSTMQSYREKISTSNNEEEKTLSNIEKSMNTLYELVMRMF